MYIQSARALLDSMREMKAEKESDLLTEIDELPKTQKLTIELQFLLDIRDCELSTLCDLVTIESFKSLMEREGHLMRELDFFSIKEARLRFCYHPHTHEDGGEDSPYQPPSSLHERGGSVHELLLAPICTESIFGYGQ